MDLYRGGNIRYRSAADRVWGLEICVVATKTVL